MSENAKHLDSWRYTAEDGWIRPGPDVNHFDEAKEEAKAKKKAKKKVIDQEAIDKNIEKIEENIRTQKSVKRSRKH